MNSPDEHHGGTVAKRLGEHVSPTVGNSQI